MKNQKLTSLFAGMLCGVWVLMSSAQINAQGFEYNFGGNSEDQGQAILQTNDRGYLIAGYSESFGPDGDLDVYVVRTDVDGQEIWSNFFDEGFIEHAYGMDATSDGAYVIVGDIRPTALDSFNVLLLKISPHGDLLWSKNFGSTGFEQGFDVQATADGGFVIAGRKLQPGGDLDIYAIKTDADGNVIWEKTFGGPGDDEGWSVEEAIDGYVIGGNAVNPGTGSSDMYVLKLDFDGNQVWDYYFDFPDTFEQGFGMTLASDGSYVVAGHTGFLEILVGKLSADGTTELWTQFFSDGIGGQGNDVVETEDGNFVVGGILETDPTNIDLFIAKVNAADGEPIWSQVYGRPQTIDWAESLVERGDDGFALAGWDGLNSAVFTNDMKMIKADSDGRVRTNYIIGKVYYDVNKDLTQDPGEPGLNDWVVEATGDNGSWFGTADANGHFSVLVDTGTYSVKAHVRGLNVWESAFPAINLGFTAAYDTLEVEFPMYAFQSNTCPDLFIDLTTDAVVACENSTFKVTYRNEGTATATGVQVKLILEPEWTFISSTISGTQTADTVTFQISDLAVGQTGGFEVVLAADCDAEVGTNFFVQAVITHDANCQYQSPLWDGSSVQVKATCNENDGIVTFTISNTGGDMLQTLDYIVIEDEIMGYSSGPGLSAGSTMQVEREATGSTWRLIAQQSQYHPGKSLPTVAVEGCVTGGGQNFSRGYVTMFPEDEADNFIAIDVQESVAGIATIDLRAYPKGYNLEDGDTIAANIDLEYHVLFQNTTEDTLYWVAIRDSLTLEHLNIGTIQPGASSHPCNFQAYDNGVVKFVFDNIVLPPASVDPEASKGFVQFRISQQPDLDPGTEIFNKALLFVGYDEFPVESAQKRHVIAGLSYFIIVDDEEVPVAGASVKVYPNPMSGESNIVVEGMTFNQLELKVYHVSGQLVAREKTTGNQIALKKGNLKAGAYFFSLEADGQMLKTGKIIVQ